MKESEKYIESRIEKQGAAALTFHPFFRNFLVMPHTSDDSKECIFCRIIRKELPSEVVYETGQVIALLDIHPVHLGHTLVVPKTHCRDLLSVPEADFHELLRVSQLVARGLVSALDLKGFNMFSNNGRIAGQTVFHFHIHITPRYADDRFHLVPQLKSYPDGAMAEYGRKIRQHIAQSSSS